MLKISAIIVKFGPAQPIMLDNISLLASMGVDIILIENTPESDDLQFQSDISYIFNGNKHGLAGGLNAGIRAAIDSGAEYVFLLDQDMELQRDLLEVYFSRAKKTFSDSTVACCGPSFREVKTNRVHGFARYGFLNINSKIINNKFEASPCLYLITSGTIIRSDVFDIVGFMDESLYIDYIDIEWCLRAKSKGFTIMGIQDLYFPHNIGDSLTSFLGFKVPVHNSLRFYYQTRNLLILCKRQYIPKYWKICELIYGIKRSIFYCSTNKSLLSVLAKGIIDGIKSKDYDRNNRFL